MLCCDVYCCCAQRPFSSLLAPADDGDSADAMGEDDLEVPDAQEVLEEGYDKVEEEGEEEDAAAAPKRPRAPRRQAASRNRRNYYTRQKVVQLHDKMLAELRSLNPNRMGSRVEASSTSVLKAIAGQKGIPLGTLKRWVAPMGRARLAVVVEELKAKRTNQKRSLKRFKSLGSGCTAWFPTAEGIVAEEIRAQRALQRPYSLSKAKWRLKEEARKEVDEGGRMDTLGKMVWSRAYLQRFLTRARLALRKPSTFKTIPLGQTIKVPFPSFM